jgi:hypothetical protein
MSGPTAGLLSISQILRKGRRGSMGIVRCLTIRLRRILVRVSLALVKVS